MGCWLGESEYNCPTCGGNKESACKCCGSVDVCQDCDGTGWDAERIDIKAYQAAENALNQKCWDAGQGMGSYEWMEGDMRIGRKTEQFGSIRAADFLLVDQPNP